MDYNKLGQKIRIARESKGFTQEKLGDALSVSKSTVSSWELGKNKINHEDLVKIDKLLGSDLALYSKESNKRIELEDLYNISSIEELNDNISLLISNINIQSSHPDIIKLMVKDFLYMEVAYTSNYLSLDDNKEESYTPSDVVNSSIFRNWGSIDWDIDCMFGLHGTYEETSYKNPILSWITYIHDKIKFSICENQMHEYPENYTLEIAFIAMDIYYELSHLIPDSEYENEIMMEFRFAINSLYQLL